MGAFKLSRTRPSMVKRGAAVSADARVAGRSKDRTNKATRRRMHDSENEIENESHFQDPTISDQLGRGQVCCTRRLRSAQTMTSRLRPLPTLLGALLLTAAVHPQEAPPLQRPLDPAGDVVLGSDGRMAEGALPVAIHRSPDTGGPDGGGRYLVVVNSGFGSEVSRKFEHARQSLQVIDLNASPAPMVVQEVFFPSPQSANVGLAFGRTPSAAGAWPLYVSGGVQNHVWR